MADRDEMAARLDQLRELPDLPDKLARLLAFVSEFVKRPREDAAPLQLRADIQAVCAFFQREYGANAIREARRIALLMHNDVYARIIVRALENRERAAERRRQGLPTVYDLPRTEVGGG